MATGQKIIEVIITTLGSTLFWNTVQTGMDIASTGLTPPKKNKKKNKKKRALRNVEHAAEMATRLRTLTHSIQETIATGALEHSDATPPPLTTELDDRNGEKTHC